MRRVLIAVGLLTLMAAPSWAGGGGFGLFGSGWGPDQADGVYGGGLKIEADVSHGLDFEFKTSFFDRLRSDYPGDIDLEWSATIADMGLAYNFNREGLNPYLGLGASYYFFDTVERGQGTIKNDIGWYVEGGLEVPIGSRWAFFAEVLWRQMEMTLSGDGLGFNVEKLIYDISGPAANLGIMITW